MKLKFRILDNRIGSIFDLPKYQTEGSAGLDLLACIDNDLVLMPNESTIIESEFQFISTIKILRA